MRLAPLTREQCQTVRKWRNEEQQFLRTPYFLTEEMQDEFYDNVVSNRDSRHRYFALLRDAPNVRFLGMGGLTNIEWENGCAEISLILHPEDRGCGYGREAVDLLLDHGFNNLRLATIYGEVYGCGNVGFWDKIVEEKNAYKTQLIGRKLHEGVLYNSMWFAFRGQK